MRQFISVLLVFVTTLASAQNSTDALMQELDSLRGVMFTFNYADDSTGGNDFFSFENRIQEILAVGEAKDLWKVYFQSQSLQFLHLKYQDNRRESLSVLDKGIKKARLLEDSVHLSRFIYYKGNLAFRFDDYDSAAIYFEKSLHIGRALENLSLQAAAINALAVCYAQLGRDQEATKYYSESASLAMKAGQERQALTSYLNLGNAYGRMEVADSAIYFAQKAYDLSVEMNETSVKWGSMNSLAMALYLNQEYEKAIDLSQSLENEVNEIGEVGFLMTSYLIRSKAYESLGQTSNALIYAQKSMEIINEFEAVDNEMRTLRWLITLEDKLQNFQSAFRHQQRLTALEDSLNRIQVNQRLEQLSAEYETEKKEIALQNLRAVQAETASKLKFKNLMFLFLVISFVLLVGVMVFIYRRKMEKERMIQQKIKNELLRTQLNPHFLFNALSSIQLFLINNGKENAALEYLSKFAKLMRRILENSRRDFVSLEEETSTLRHYLDLQSVRFGHSFEYKIEVNTVDHLDEIHIPPMFAQPFIENSLEHGIASVKNGKIYIRFDQDGDMMRFTVEDNGIGISKSTAMREKEGHVSMATKITEDRVEVLKRQLRKNISFIVRDRLSESNEVIGTEVVFNIPIQYS